MMVSIRTRTYEVCENREMVYSRLKWAVEQVDGEIGQWTASEYKTDDIRPWIGVLNKEESRFELMAPQGIIEIKALRIWVLGEISVKNEKSVIEVDFHLPVSNVIIFSVALVLSVWDVLFGSQSFSTLIALLISIGTWSIMLIHKLDRLESKIAKLFGVTGHKGV